MAYLLFYVFGPAEAPDEEPCQAPRRRPGRREGDQGTSVLPLDRLGPSGEAGAAAALQTQNCQCEQMDAFSLSLSIFTLPPSVLSLSFSLSFFLSLSHSHTLSFPPLCYLKGTFRELWLSLPSSPTPTLSLVSLHASCVG